jgi:hypothetical protein
MHGILPIWDMDNARALRRYGIAPIWTAMEHDFAPICHKNNARQYAAVEYNSADFGLIWAKIMHCFCVRVGNDNARLCVGMGEHNARDLL